MCGGEGVSERSQSGGIEDKCAQNTCVHRWNFHTTNKEYGIKTLCLNILFDQNEERRHEEAKRNNFVWVFTNQP